MPTGNVRNVINRAQEFVPFLAELFDVTTEYGSPVAAGPDAGQPHYAVDFGTPDNTPLFSMGSGRVLQPNANPEGVTGGNTLTIDYGNGIIVTFAHLARTYVKPGDNVAPGDWIGDTGHSGIATGPHLHVDAWRNGAKIDVRTLIDPLSDFADYEAHPGATGGSVPILGPLTGGARGVGEAFGDWGAAIVGLVSALLNPANWARILAMFGGAILAAFGAYMLWQSTGSA